MSMRECLENMGNSAETLYLNATNEEMKDDGYFQAIFESAWFFHKQLGIHAARYLAQNGGGACRYRSTLWELPNGNRFRYQNGVLS